PLPKQTKGLAVPTDQRVRFDDDEGISPIKEMGEPSQSKANGVSGAAWPHFSFYEQAELFAKKEVFGHDSSRRPKTQPHKSQCVEENSERRSNKVQKRFHDSILSRHPRIFTYRTDFLRRTGQGMVLPSLPNPPPAPGGVPGNAPAGPTVPPKLLTFVL